MRRKSAAYVKSLLPSWLLERVFSTYDRILRSRGIRLVVSHRILQGQESKVSIVASRAHDLSNWAIIFQGLIASEADFSYLVKSIQVTRSTYPDIGIILSTYAGPYVTRMTQDYRDLAVQVVTSADVGRLPYPFPPSLCQQISTSGVGVEFAHSQGFSRVAKIRVDQRLTAPIGLLHADSVLNLIPARGATSGMRILGTSMNSYLPRALGISDMLQFGHTADMKRYWEPIGTLEWLAYTKQLSIEYPDPLWRGFQIPETWLAARYALESGISLTDPKKATWSFWRDIAGVVDAQSVGQEWRKAFEWLGSNYRTRKWFEEDRPPRNEELNFAMWLEIAISEAECPPDFELLEI